MKSININIRASENEKRIIQTRASSMFMTMSEYLIHAGICYEPSAKTKDSLDHLNKVMKGEVSFICQSCWESGIRENSCPHRAKTKDLKA
jgi:hypothetical protein